MFDPSGNAACPATFNSITRNATLYYKNTCGLYQSYSRPISYSYGNSFSATTYDAFTSVYKGGVPNGTMTPENIRPGDAVTLRIDEAPTGSGISWLHNTTNYEQYVIVTLPEGFDYDDTQPGFAIRRSFKSLFTSGWTSGIA